MMRAYAIDRAGVAEFGTIDASHFCSLTSLRCERCGFWRTAGLEYPSISPSSLGDRFQQRLFYGPPDISRPLSVQELEAFRIELAPILGSARSLEPGASFGPLTGRAARRMGDFAWVGLRTVLVRASVYVGLLDAGFPVLGVPADLYDMPDDVEPLVELEAAPIARLLSSMRPESCSTCGRLEGIAIERPAIERESFDERIPLQRILDWPTRLVVNEALADFIRQQKLRDVILTPLEVV